MQKGKRKIGLAGGATAWIILPLVLLLALTEDSRGGSISGTITAPGQVEDIYVRAYDPGWAEAGSAQAGPSGSYTISPLSDGSYCVRTWAQDAPFGNEYYDDAIIRPDGKLRMFFRGVKSESARTRISNFLAATCICVPIGLLGLSGTDAWASGWRTAELIDTANGNFTYTSDIVFDSN